MALDFPTTRSQNNPSNSHRWRSSRITATLIIMFIIFGTIHTLTKQTTISAPTTNISNSISTSLTFLNQNPNPNTNELPTHKYAYCVFLAPNINNGTTIQTEDHYFTGTRMLIHSLLHDPQTRTTNNIPFIVLVTPDITPEARARLIKDGASIVEVPPIVFSWIKPGRERWEHVMSKLHVFSLIQYEKILLLDSDHVVVRPLDAIFDDPATMEVENLRSEEQVREDEGTQPATYIMAGNSGPTESPHPYPAPRGNRLNAGFVILKPSIEMFEHYMTVAGIEGRFPGGSPEQDLWNYVHRRNGNMPWKQIDPDWTVNTPCYGDYENGIASFHEKYWSCHGDLELRDVLLRSRWKMEAFFEAYDRYS